MDVQVDSLGLRSHLDPYISCRISPELFVVVLARPCQGPVLEHPLRKRLNMFAFVHILGREMVSVFGKGRRRTDIDR